MATFCDRIFRSGDAREVVLRSGAIAVTREELGNKIENLAAYLRDIGAQCVALYADNGPEWIFADLACQQAGILSVPVPLFFSDEQIRHTLELGGADVLLTDQVVDDGRLAETAIGRKGCKSLESLRVYSLEPRSMARVPANAQKITFTSGTTGAPKGVCLSTEQQLTVARSLATAIDIDAPRHLCILPLSTLLENLAGVYTPFMSGGTVIVPSLSDVGLVGSSKLDAPRLLESITREQPNSLILVPEILGVLTIAAEGGWRPPSSLLFVAVGGGKVSVDLLLRARNAGLPVYEGYGLSECGSVVALNVPAADKAGTVGRPLPHVEIKIESSEIVVTGSAFLGYLDQPDSWRGDAVRTGDLGHIDGDGYVHIDGRAKSQLITSYGRNLSPEWVEGELLSGPLLQQAIVIGDARPWCVALLWPHHSTTTDEEIEIWIRKTNSRLPDYARIADWRRLPEPLTNQNGMLTENGRTRRNEIVREYEFLIEQMYTEHAEASNQ